MSEGSGIRSTVAFEPPVDCPIATLSERADTRIRSVRASTPPPGDTPSVSEFIIAGATVELDGVDTVFSVGDISICRTAHDDRYDCPCMCLGEHGTPISRYKADNGKLTIIFHTATFEELQAIIGDLQDRFPGMDIRRMIRAPSEYREHDQVLVDTGSLTERQLEMLEVAYRRGYFDRPRGANATEIADVFGIDPSTFREHINIGLSKILDSVLLTD